MADLEQRLRDRSAPLAAEAGLPAGRLAEGFFVAAAAF
jgi:hypothetical protein